MTEKAIYYPRENLCKSCVADLAPDATTGSCWLKDQAEKIVFHVSQDNLEPEQGKYQLSKRSQDASKRGCRMIQSVRLETVARLSNRFYYLTRGHSRIMSTTSKEK